jgi:cysteine-rich repeat protein
MNRISLLTLAIAGIAASATGAAAGLTTVGYEYRPARSLVRDATSSSCRLGGGIRIEVFTDCRGDGPPCLDAEVSVSWRNADDEVIAGPVGLGTVSSWDTTTVHCSKRGTAVLMVDDRFRIAHINGSLGAEHRILPDGVVSEYDHTAAATPEGFFLSWTNSGSTVVRGRFVRDDGTGDGPVLEIAAPETDVIHGSTSPYLGPQLAAIATSGDRVVVAWVSHRSGTYHSDVRAVLVDRSGTVGDAIRLNQFTLGEFSDLELHREDASTSIATWFNGNQGGAVARRVAPDDSLPTTTTTTTTLDPRAVEFFPPQTLGDSDSDYFFPLAGSTLGRWFAGKATSTDDARRWVPADTGAIRATDHSGRWLGIRDSLDDEGTLAILVSSSDDDGATWSEPFDLYRSNLGAKWHGVRPLTLAAGSDDHWIAAWFERAQREDGPNREDLLCGVRVAASSDRGATWQPARTLVSTECDGIDSLSLATDRAGGWLLAWSRDEVGVSRSLDNGATWSDPIYPELGPAALRPGTLDVAATGEGSWLLVVQSFAKIVGGSAEDRLYIARSNDTGATWSEPERLFPAHDDFDGGDFSPSLACGPGRCGLVWSSLDGDDGAGLDIDVFAAFTGDGGVSWSAPRLVDETARDDDFSDYEPELVVTPAGTWGLVWTVRTYGEPGRGIRFARSRGDCGDGVADGTEECDDANTVDGDGCDSICLVSGCGNTAVSPDEECDDGNSDETDECISDCRVARCGDGYLRGDIEPCDDGNTSTTDACQPECRASYCGDGFVYEGVEECDFGAGMADYGQCLTSCRLARCGDGFIHEDVEECDDDNLENGDRCTKRCRIDRYCGWSPDGGAITASNALVVLKKAVGRRVRCPKKRCDLDDDGHVSSSDALRALRVAVGSLAAGDCEERTLVFRLTSSELLGALQFHLDWDQAEGDFGARAECSVLLDDVLSAVNVDAGRGFTNGGVVSLDGFRGPVDFMRCTWRGRAGTGTEKMTLDIVDATDPAGDLQSAAVEIRLE